VEFIFILYYPVGQQLRLDLPGVIVFMHLKNDAIAAIVGNIYREQNISRGA
jgi:hypothetical protein